METELRLDRTAFHMGNHEQASHQLTYWRSRSVTERLRAAAYLNSVAFDYPLDTPPPLDRGAFSVRKHRG